MKTPNRKLRFNTIQLAAATVLAHAATLSAQPMPPMQAHSQLVSGTDLQAPSMATVLAAQAISIQGLAASPKVVKGAPYCATAVHETVQTLQDGNRIVNKRQAQLCRDGEGRTRQEAERQGQRMVYLNDPLAKESWILDPQRKTARRGAAHLAGHLATVPEGEDWREHIERLRQWARHLADRARPAALQPSPSAAQAGPNTPTVPSSPATAQTPHVPPQHGEPVVIVQHEVSSERPGGGPQRELQVKVIRAGHGAPMHPLPDMPDMPALPALGAQKGAVIWHGEHLAPRGPGVSTSLGTREIEGLRVHGERTTWTIEPGKVGNEKPIVIVREVWTSPELMLTVQSRDFDPRSGEVTYRLSQLNRTEPDAALMKVPADHTVVRPGAAPTKP